MWLGSVALLALLFVPLTASPASAWQYNGSVGSPGAVTATAAVNFGILNQGSANALTIYGDRGPTVRRSPATTGRQNVSIRYSVQVYTANGWTEVAGQVSSATIPAGISRIAMPAPYVIPTSGVNHYYRVLEAFAWYGAATGRLLGFTVIIPTAVSDHVCLYRPCAAAAGYLWAGG